MRLRNILYRVYSFLFSFIPIGVSNYKFRKTLLLPLYSKFYIRRQQGGGINLSNDPERQLRQNSKTVIYMVQRETTFSGGLSDRFRGIISIYAECKRQNLPFRIVFEPLHIQDYIQPNQYDWQIRNEDIIWDTDRCYPCTILTYRHNLKNPIQRYAQITFLRHFLRKRYEQIHVYSNMATAEDNFGQLFEELFKPSKELQEQIDHHLKQLGGKGSYISMTFRFRQLLGDFKEGGDVLPAEKREEYIQLCIKCVERIHQQTIGKKILVTADSSLFLDKLYSKIYEDGNSRPSTNQDWLYIIPGKVVHMGFTFDADEKVYMKSFVDFFMLSYASVTYQVTDKLLMNSGFPKRASMLGENQYKEVRL